MAKMVQIRHVPEAVHRKLKKQAAEEGLSLSDYLRQQVEIIAKQPTMKEMIARLEALPPLPVPESAAELVRAGREERVQQIWEAISEREPERRGNAFEPGGDDRH